MTVYDWYGAFSSLIPSALSAPWDNDGMMCVPEGEKEVKKIVFALDVTDSVVSYAIDSEADLIVSHHPLIFSPLTAITPKTAVGARILRLIAHKIAVFSFHTRFDAVKGGVNDTLAKQLKLTDITPLGEGEAALGRIGKLPRPLSFKTFCERVKKQLGTPVLNGNDRGKTVSRVAIVGGEGKDFISFAIAAGADTYLSGRLGYHAMQDAPINLVEAGHFYTERQAVATLAEMAKGIDANIDARIFSPNPISFY